ncbi:hypothetical protein CVD28_00585 [Bacillus sp. M6-12]|uniref:hypothetical protein n=1 Tax=Bacillus sp. M6-12 TaxID=2054166 RepID=UPI000C7688E4|nr:hypothetical protein [Bacillus sp. M6-12]PLS18931.1 hypothetical protein CVD28_00585 [Bacillus sp. M6-12]
MDLAIKNYQAQETDRGLAYEADILLGDTKIGSLENPGDGSYTRIYITADKEAFNQKMNEHFTTLGWDTTDEEEYALHYTFAEHLLDIHDNGEVSEEYKKMGFLH